ncbi:MAG: iron-sulfur cluster assembly scaffold protein [Alphaproteobacteria bacterium]|nr:iron-sulfur cluster assembly scaffold protein [Alphaproteobacteria bacterium]
MSESSFLDGLYHRDIITLARRGRDRGRLDAADRSARADNPLCGDRVTMDLDLDNDRIARIGHRVRGCALCEAAAEIIAEEAVGVTESEVAAVRSALQDYLGGESGDPLWEQLKIFAPVSRVPSRHECVLLAFDAVLRALKS